jgi:hypothetical protein
MAECPFEAGVRAGRKTSLNKRFTAMAGVMTAIEKLFSHVELGSSWCFVPE